MIHPIDVDSLLDLVQKDQVIMIDVREDHEYKEGHIKSAELVPLSTFNPKDLEVFTQDDKKIVMICRVGGRSMKACLLAQEYGLTKDLYNLNGGMTQWKAKGYPIEVSS